MRTFPVAKERREPKLAVKEVLYTCQAQASLMAISVLLLLLQFLEEIFNSGGAVYRVRLNRNACALRKGLRSRHVFRGSRVRSIGSCIYVHEHQRLVYCVQVLASSRIPNRILFKVDERSDTGPEE